MGLKFKGLFNQYIEPVDRIVWLFCGMMVLFASYCFIFNELVTKYPGNHYLPWQWLLLLPFVIAIYAMACYARQITPRLAFFTRFYTLYYFVVTAMALMTNGVQFTPFPTIDHIMVEWDRMLGVDTPSILAWTAHTPWIRTLFIYAYNAVTLQMVILPILLAALFQQRALNEFLVLICFCYLVGFGIYYFFPTAAPSSVFHSTHFLPNELATSLKFRQIHEHIMPTTDSGGMIAFPSFHVVFSILCAYVVRHKKWLFIPFIVINSVTIISTVVLGWHYLMDVFGGILLITLAIAIFRKCNRDVIQKTLPRP